MTIREPLDPAEADRLARSRQIRQQAGIGLRAMATEAGLSRGYVSQLERGICRPGRSALRWLALLAVLDSGGWQTYPGGAPVGR